MSERLYQKLLAWQQAHRLCLFVYNLTKKFPKDEHWRLVDQIARAVGSVPANIAEGNTRRSLKEKRRYFEIALASLEEVHYHGFLAKDLAYISHDDFQKLDQQIQSIGYLLTKLRASLVIRKLPPSISPIH